MNLHFQNFGSSFPLVILHGLFGSSDNWQSLGKRLGQHFNVYALDQRNHGNSPHAAEFNYDVMAEDLREFFTAHQIQRAHVLGHSMGGKTAMQFALTCPELVEKLVVVDIAPKKYPRTHDYIFDALFTTEIKGMRTRSAVDAALTNQIPDASTRHFLLKNLMTEENGTLRWKINFASLHQHYETILDTIPGRGRFDKPTLFIRGGRSDYLRPLDEPLILSQFPIARFATIAQADHWVHADAPNEFLQILLSFLDS